MVSVKSKKSTRTTSNHILEHKKKFEKFHSGNGVRTIMGGIGPVPEGTRKISQFIDSIAYLYILVRMLLKNGYRYVYISRKFAMKHGFIPADAAPGHYGYGGLVKCVLSPDFPENSSV